MPIAIDGQWLPAHELAEAIGTYDRWVYRKVAEHGIEPQVMQHDGYTTPCYPPSTLELLKAEFVLTKRRREEKRPRSVREIADQLGCSGGWVTKQIKQLGLRPLRYELRGPKQAAIYSHASQMKIKERQPPSADGWYNLHQLVLYTGHDREWIERRLTARGIERERRRSAESGHEGWFYPPESLDYLQSLEKTPPAGDWVTAYMLVELTGRSYPWIMRRLDDPRYELLSEMRLDDQQVPRKHYPPAVLAEMRAATAELMAYPTAGDYVTVSTIAAVVQRSTLWVENRLERVGAVAEMRRDGKNRPNEHFHPEVIGKLKRIADTEKPPPIGWLQISRVLRLFDITQEEMRRRLESIPHRTLERRAPETGRLETYYSPATCDALKRSLEDVPFDRLIDAEPYRKLAFAFKDEHDLTLEQLGSLLHATARLLHRSRRIRMSLARRIEALPSIPSAAIARVRLSVRERTIDELKEIASRYDRPIGYVELHAERFDLDRIYEHWETIAQALRASGLEVARTKA